MCGIELSAADINCTSEKMARIYKQCQSLRGNRRVTLLREIFELPPSKSDFKENIAQSPPNSPSSPAEPTTQASLTNI